MSYQKSVDVTGMLFRIIQQEIGVCKFCLPHVIPLKYFIFADSRCYWQNASWRRGNVFRCRIILGARPFRADCNLSSLLCLTPGAYACSVCLSHFREDVSAGRCWWFCLEWVSQERRSMASRTSSIYCLMIIASFNDYSAVSCSFRRFL